ncbi:MAG: (Fe-S)-binding protein [Thermoplasmata archaeon]|nr:(Fe-S)-binding protein [Thermoplasmata archaeon]
MSFAMMQEIEKIKRTCILCGKCTAACPSCAHGGIDPMEIMAGGEEGLDQCILCGTCSQVCHRSDPFTVIRCLIYMEQDLSVSDTFKQTGYVRAPAEDRCIEPVWTGDDAYVMPGCVVGGMAPFIEYASSVAMDAVGVRASKLPKDMCCLHPIQFMDVPAHEKREMKKGMCDSANGKDIVTLCAGCSDELSPVDQKVRHIIAFLSERMDSLPKFDSRIRVGMEPGCSAMPLKKEMRAILERMNCEVVNHEYGCCGKSAPVAPELMAEREAECEKADVIVVGCPMCFVKFDAMEGGKPVVHLAELVAMAAGHPESLAFHKIPVPTVG